MTAPATRRPAVGETGRRALLVAVALTIALYVVPGGSLIGRPLVWVATLVHELGHAAVTVALGGEVLAVRVFADGSGVATSTRPAGRLRTAATAAGGLLGPAAAAAALFALARRARTARVAGGVAGAALLLSTVFALRGPLAIVLGLVLGVGLVALSLRAPPATTQLVLVFVAVQLALSVFSRSDYLFTPTAQTGAGQQLSDSGQLAAALIGPYWFWGAVCGVLSLLVLAIGVMAFLRRASQPRRAT